MDCERGRVVTWTHNMCAECWQLYHAPRQPVSLKDDDNACCFCGKQNTDGIYVRRDPSGMQCSHEDEE